jgi:hypothetical protein
LRLRHGRECGERCGGSQKSLSQMGELEARHCKVSSGLDAVEKAVQSFQA